VTESVAQHTAEAEVQLATQTHQAIAGQEHHQKAFIVVDTHNQHELARVAAMVTTSHAPYSHPHASYAEPILYDADFDVAHE